MRQCTLTFTLFGSLWALGCGSSLSTEEGPGGPTQKHPPFRGLTLTEANFDEEVLRSSQPVLVEFWRDG
jgi:hypothetical protein